VKDPRAGGGTLHPSQLRRLARAYADGEIGREDYLVQRRALLEAISAGTLAIEREEPPGAAPSERPSPPPPAPPPGPRIPLRRAAAALAVVLAVLLVWVLLPEPARDTAPPSPAAPPAVPQRQISAARSLVEAFLAEKDWSAAALSGLEQAWRELPAGERQAAAGRPWLRRLANALRQELRTQQALAEIDSSGAAEASIERLRRLAGTLGVVLAPPPGAPVSPPAPPAAPPASAPPPPAAPPPQSGASWLAAQPPERYTLQLFAVEHLDRVERLIAAHPRLGFRVVASDGDSPRYRVLYGSFASAEEARRAYGALPEALRREQPNPLVRRFAELTTATSRARQPATPGGYTLQVLASNDRANAERLIAAYPRLALRLRETPGAALRYRVLLGHFPSDAAARRALAGLPAELLRAAGTPLVKRIEDL